MKEIAYITGLLFLVALVLFYRSPAPDMDSFSVQIYDVPANHQKELVRLLNKNFNNLTAKDEGNIARAEVLSNGQVLLFGSEAVHTGFRNIVSNLEDSHSEPVTSINYKVQAWLVAGDSEGTTKDVPPELSDTFKELEHNTPGRVFHVLERMELIVGENSHGRNSGKLFDLHCWFRPGKHSPECNVTFSKKKNVQTPFSVDTQFAVDTKKTFIIFSTQGNLIQNYSGSSTGDSAEDTELFFLLKLSKY